MFHSTTFAIEHRAGLEDQTLDAVMSALRRLEAPSLFPGTDSIKKMELARWLSDWHLMSYLDTTQLFSVVRMLSFMLYCALEFALTGGHSTHYAHGFFAGFA